MMAKKFQNNKNFLIIEMPWREYVAITDSWGLCSCCGQYDSEAIFYYVAVINDFFCKTCFDAWYSGATHYSVDLQKERQNWNKTVEKLRDVGVWNENRN